MKTLLVIIGLSAVPALAQEPRTQIRPADPIPVAVRTPTTPTVAIGESMPAPTIYPNPLPRIDLAEIARRMRVAKASAPKAVKVADQENPIVPEPVKQVGN